MQVEHSVLVKAVDSNFYQIYLLSRYALSKKEEMGVLRDAYRLATVLCDLTIKDAINKDSSLVIEVDFGITDVEADDILLILVLE